MSSERYTISDQHSTHFLTLTIIHWIDLFSRIEYRDIIVNSLNYCTEEKGLDIFAWVIMSNHLHLVARCREPHHLSDFLRDFKKFTSKKLIDEIMRIPESRREWLLHKFSFEAERTSRAEFYKVWTEKNPPIDLENFKIDIMQKIDYTHENPVRAGVVRNPDEYVYSSAFDYTRKGNGLVKVVII